MTCCRQLWMEAGSLSLETVDPDCMVLYSANRVDEVQDALSYFTRDTRKCTFA